MKKILPIIICFGIIILIGHNNFGNSDDTSYYSLPMPITEEQFVENLNEITIPESNDYFRRACGWSALLDHSVFSNDNTVMVCFNLSNEATKGQIISIINYCYETFWQGNVQIMALPPYQQPIHRSVVEKLIIQIYCNEQLILKETFTNPDFSLDNFKKFDNTRETDNKYSFDYQKISGNALNTAEFLSLCFITTDNPDVSLRYKLLSEEKILSVSTSKILSAEKIENVCRYLIDKKQMDISAIEFLQKGNIYHYISV